MLTKRYYIGDILDTPVYVSRLWIVVFAIVSWSFSQTVIFEQYITATNSLVPYTVTAPPVLTDESLFNLPNVTYGIVVAGSLYGSVLTHEFGHVYGGLRNNMLTESITLWLLGGVAQMKEEPETAWSEFELTVLGPATSFAIMAGAFIAVLVTAPFGIMSLTAYLHMLVILNGGILLLNLVPAFPLDGGRILRSLLSFRFSQKRSTRYTTRIAKGIAIGIVITATLSASVLAVVLGVFIYVSSRNEQQRIETSLPPYMRPSVDPIQIENKTFVFEVTNSELSTPFPLQLVTKRGGQIEPSITGNTDYIVVSNTETDKYQALADNYNANVVSAARLDEALQLTESSFSHR